MSWYTSILCVLGFTELLTKETHLSEKTSTIITCKLICLALPEEQRLHAGGGVGRSAPGGSLQTLNSFLICNSAALEVTAVGSNCQNSDETWP